jgi:hypothetical protein
MPRCVVNFTDDGRAASIVFWCPGCCEKHLVNLDEAAGLPAWRFYGSLDEPTIRPSLKLPGICHAVITGGWIEYLDDCRHGLGGMVLPLPDAEYWLHL